MELIDLEKRAFLYALKAIYFDQGGALSSAVDYYVVAGETLLEAAERGSRIPDLKRKARLYCLRAEALQRTLNDEADEEHDWDRLEDAVSGGVEATEMTGRDVASADYLSTVDTAAHSSTVDDVLLHDFVVIYHSAVDGAPPNMNDDNEDVAAGAKTPISRLDAKEMARLTRRLFASALEADAAGNVEDAFLLYMRAVEGTIADQRRDAEIGSGVKTPEEIRVEKKMRVLALNAIERIEVVRDELIRRSNR